MGFLHFPIDEQTRQFMDLVRGACHAHGVEMYLGKGKNVLYRDLSCLGYFDDMHHAPPRYSVATGKPVSEWLPIAVHEFEHMNQWIERAPAWTNQVMSPHAYAIDVLGEWFAGRQIEKEEVSKLIRLAREVERDCEARTVDSIVKYQLPLDPARYARQANAYVFYYTAMAETRKWFVHSPRNIPEVLKLMPDRILPEDAYDELPREYLEVFRKYMF